MADLRTQLQVLGVAKRVGQVDCHLPSSCTNVSVLLGRERILDDHNLSELQSGTLKSTGVESYDGGVLLGEAGTFCALYKAAHMQPHALLFIHCDTDIAHVWMSLLPHSDFGT